MLEYSKTLLKKVSFDRLLFRKELKKAIRWVSKEELVVLQIWCLATFGGQYKDIIVDSFSAMVS